MISPGKLQEAIAGGAISAEQWNLLVKAARLIYSIAGGGVYSQGGFIGVRNIPSGSPVVLGIIDGGETEEEPPTAFAVNNNRYWVRLLDTQAAPAVETIPTASTLFTPLAEGARPDRVVATNLAERWAADQTGELRDSAYRRLPNGTVVKLYSFPTSDGIVFFFDRLPYDEFWCRLGSATPIDADGEEYETPPEANEQFRWKYTGTEVLRQGTEFVGSPTFEGRSITGAINSAEDPNDGTGTEGHGAEVTGPPATSEDDEVYTLPASAGSPVVRMYGEVGADGEWHYTFQFPNALKVICGVPAEPEP